MHPWLRNEPLLRSKPLLLLRRRQLQWGVGWVVLGVVVLVGVALLPWRMSTTTWA
jgi:hypothetical protein